MSTFGTELESMMTDVIDGLADRTVTVRHNAPGAFTSATLTRAKTPSDDTGVAAVFHGEQASFDQNGARVTERRYTVQRSDLTADPDEWSQVVDGSDTFRVSDVVWQAGRKACVLICRTTKRD
jgi:hypothetical protein